MVRTLADGGSKKAVAAKAPRKNFGGGSGGSSSVYNSSPSSNSANFGSFNHARMWPTPTWQKGINNFFKKGDKPDEPEEPASNSDSSEHLEDSDVIVTSVACSGSSSGDGGSSSVTAGRIYSDEEDKENIDPSSSPERLSPKVDGRTSEGGSNSTSPSPKQRRKTTGKQKAGPCKKKKRMVLREDSDYED